jgi:hypothetical protein
LDSSDKKNEDDIVWQNWDSKGPKSNKEEDVVESFYRDSENTSEISEMEQRNTLQSKQRQHPKIFDPKKKDDDFVGFEIEPDHETIEKKNTNEAHKKEDNDFWEKFNESLLLDENNKEKNDSKNKSSSSTANESSPLSPKETTANNGPISASLRLNSNSNSNNDKHPNSSNSIIPIQTENNNGWEQMIDFNELNIVPQTRSQTKTNNTITTNTNNNNNDDNDNNKNKDKDKDNPMSISNASVDIWDFTANSSPVEQPKHSMQKSTTVQHETEKTEWSDFDEWEEWDNNANKTSYNDPKKD